MAACGAAPQQPPQTPDKEPSASKAEGAATKGEEESGPGTKSDAAAPRVLADHERDYKNECAKSADLASFCDCAWKLFAGAVTLDEMNRDQIPSSKLEVLTKKTGQECGEKMPESMLRDGFMKGCTKDDPALKDYCECFWPEIRASFSLAEIARGQVVGTPKHAQVSKQAGAKCGSKLPEATVKSGFIRGCTGEGGASEKFCECAWKQIRTVMTPVQVQSTPTESPEFKSAQKKIEAGCGALRAAK